MQAMKILARQLFPSLQLTLTSIFHTIPTQFLPSAQVPIRGCWEELSSTLTALCPSLQQLTAKGVSGFSAGPLQGLSCLHTLEISFLVVEQSLQSALNSLGSLVTLTRLSVSFGTLAEVSQVVSIAALGKLQRLQHLSLVLPGTTLQGVSGVATGCAQLTQLNLSVRAVEAGEGEEEQQQGGADAQDGISGNGDIGGGSCSASGSGAPWWPSLQQVDLGLMDHEGECQPGHLTALHLDRARHLTQLGPWVFGCIKLNHLCSASSPGALRQLCEQLSQVSQGVRPDSLSLIDRRCGGPCLACTGCLPCPSMPRGQAAELLDDSSRAMSFGMHVLEAPPVPWHGACCACMLLNSC